MSVNIHDFLFVTQPSNTIFSCLINIELTRQNQTRVTYTLMDPYWTIFKHQYYCTLRQIDLRSWTKRVGPSVQLKYCGTFVSFSGVHLVLLLFKDCGENVFLLLLLFYNQFRVLFCKLQISKIKHIVTKHQHTYFGKMIWYKL